MHRAHEPETPEDASLDAALDAALLRTSRAAHPLLAALKPAFAGSPLSIFLSTDTTTLARPLFLDHHTGSGALSDLPRYPAIEAKAAAFRARIAADIPLLRTRFSVLEIEDRFVYARPEHKSGTLPRLPTVLRHSDAPPRKLLCLGGTIPLSIQRLADTARPGTDILLWAPAWNTKDFSAHERLQLRAHRDTFGSVFIDCLTEMTRRNGSKDQLVGLFLRRLGDAAVLSLRFEPGYEDPLAIFDVAS